MKLKPLISILDLLLIFTIVPYLFFMIVDRGPHYWSQCFDRVFKIAFKRLVIIISTSAV